MGEEEKYARNGHGKAAANAKPGDTLPLRCEAASQAVCEDGHELSPAVAKALQEVVVERLKLGFQRKGVQSWSVCGIDVANPWDLYRLLPAAEDRRTR